MNLSETNTIFKRNGYEFEFDARDADSMDLYNKAIEDMGEEERNSPKDGKSSDIIRYNCGVIKHFFDKVLGEGAGEKICTTKSNYSVCLDAYLDFLEMIKAQTADLYKKTADMAQLGNRQQRREYEKKNKGKNKNHKPTNPNLKPVK